MQTIKHLVRTISAVSNPALGTDAVGEVEKELALYFEGGWELFHVQSISVSAGNVTVLYVLLKNSPEPSITAEAQVKRGRPAKEV